MIALSKPAQDLRRAWDFLTADVQRPSIEIRIPGARIERNGLIVPNPNYAGGTVAGWFDNFDAFNTAISQVRRISVYAVINPTDPALLARKQNSLGPAKHTTRDDHIPHIHNLLIDIDSVRVEGISATEEELDRALAVRDKILNDIPRLAESAYWGTSGNGGFIWIRTDLLPGPETTRMAERFLAELDKRYSNEHVKIDTTTRNHAQLTCLPGTWKCKGENLPERPWRPVAFQRPHDINPMPWDLQGFVEALPPLPDPKARPSSPAKGRSRPSHLVGDVAERAEAYIQRFSKAISGNHGSDQTFDAACSLALFGLSYEVAMPIFERWNLTHADPQWTLEELTRKLRGAFERIEREGRIGELATAPLPTLTGRIARLRLDPPASTAGLDGPKALLALPAPAPNPELTAAIDAVAPPTDPHRLARLHVAAAESAQAPLLYSREDFYRWSTLHPAYVPISLDVVTCEVTDRIKADFDRLFAEACERAESDAEGQSAEPTDPPSSNGNGKATKAPKPTAPPKLLPVTRPIISNTLNAIRSIVSAGDLTPPAWVDPAKAPIGWNPPDVLPTRNALINLELMAIDPGNAVIRPTPNFFATYCAGCDYDPDAATPPEWIEFLGDVGLDHDAVDALAEWFGYCLTADTSFQKIFMLIGPPRSGKGTISRTLTTLVGERNVCSPTLSSLTERFGLSPLIGKTLATINDARISGRHDLAAITERLLGISGEDVQTIDRKNRSEWTGKLSARFIVLSNELPRIDDASATIANRMIFLKTTKSHLGHENRNLFAKQILPNLSGILNWAIEGRRRLYDRGKFLQPASADDLVEAMKHLSSPVTQFVEECCELDPAAKILTGDLYDAWKTWSNEQGRHDPGTANLFGRNLTSAAPSVTKSSSIRQGTKWIRWYKGIQLRAQPPF